MSKWAEALDHQVSTFAFWDSPKGIRYAEGYMADVVEKGRVGLYPQADELARNQAAVMLGADTVVVDDDMLTLVEAAAPKFEVEPLREADLLVPMAFVWLPRPIHVADVHDRDTAYRAIAWAPTPFIMENRATGVRAAEPLPGLIVTFYSLVTDRDDYYEEEVTMTVEGHAAAGVTPDNLFEPEPLHPDLVEWVRTSPAGWEVLQHPLVYTVPYDPVLNRSSNARYAFNRQRLTDALDAGDWRRAVYAHERPWRLYRLLEWHVVGIHGKRMPWRTLRGLVCEVWADAEPQNEMEWLWLWRRAHNGRLVTDDRATVRRLRREGPLRIYRGGAADDPVEPSLAREGVGVPQGLAWSTSERTAEFFAVRYSNPRPVIWTAVIPSIDDAFAYIGQRGESEVVVDPMVVSDVDRIEVEARELPSRTIVPDELTERGT